MQFGPFSPDGQWVGFFTSNAGNKLYKISVEGGAVVPLADCHPSIGGSWGVDGNIIVGAVTNGLLRSSKRRSAHDGFGKGARSARVHISASPALFVNRTQDRNADSIEVFSFADHRRKTVVRGALTPAFWPAAT